MRLCRYEPAGFFVLRTPYLPLGVFTSLNTSGGTEDDPGGSPRILARVRELLRNDWVREAIAVASPSLAERLQAESEGGDSTPSAALITAFRYLTRMATRPTPFGLFAASSLGAVGARTALELASQRRCQPRARLDMQYLTALCRALAADDARALHLRYQVNTSLYRQRDIYRYHAVDLAGSNVGGDELIEIEYTEPLALALQLARGITGYTLAERLVAAFPESTRQEACEYVAELIRSQLLVSDLAPDTAADSPTAGVSDALGAYGEFTAERRCLEQASVMLACLDREVGLGARHYHDVAALLEQLPVAPDPARLVHVDVYRPTGSCTLGSAVVTEMQRAIAVLDRISPDALSADLASLHQALLDRYEQRLVPLTLALDELNGVGFGGGLSEPEAAFILDDIPFQHQEPVPSVGQRERLFLRKLGERGTVWSLSAADLDELTDPRWPALHLPDALALRTTILAASASEIDRGNFQLAVHGALGPSGIKLLGRFCHLDEPLRRAVAAHVAAEEAMRPDAVFAEVTYLPSGKAGNVVSRPALHRYEIPFFGRARVGDEFQLMLDDLWVAGLPDRVVLWSRRLAKEVYPCLSHAHACTGSPHPVYRFFGALERQRAGRDLGWSWGGLSNSPFLPRVECGRLILSAAQWRVGQADLTPLATQSGTTRLRAMAELRERLDMPRYVAIVRADRILPLDTENALAVDILAETARAHGEATLIEWLNTEGTAPVESPEGRHSHELVVPFLCAHARPEATPATLFSSDGPQRRSAPGGEWLCVKAYTSPGEIDTLLLDAVAPVAHAALATGIADRWFFVRYADPDWHLRVRFHGSPDGLWRHTLPELRRVLTPFLVSDRVWKLQLDTYDPEVFRYGGPEAMPCAEELFWADSEAVLAVVQALRGVERSTRWQAALLGLHLMLDDFGLDLGERIDCLAHNQRVFARAEGLCRVRDGQELLRPEFVKALGAKRRQLHEVLPRLLNDSPGDAPAPWHAVRSALSTRGQAVRASAAHLGRLAREAQLCAPVISVADSQAHMHLNRLLLRNHRRQELVLDSLLLGAYRSLAARRPDS